MLGGIRLPDRGRGAGAIAAHPGGARPPARSHERRAGGPSRGGLDRTGPDRPRRDGGADGCRRCRRDPGGAGRRRPVRAATCMRQSRAVEGLGQLAIDERDDERAVSLLEEARELEPAATARMRPGCYESLGRAYAGIGDLSRAISVLRAALEETRRPPVDVRGVIRFGVYLASAYTDQGRFGDAEAVLADVLDVEAAITDPIARTRVALGDGADIRRAGPAAAGRALHGRGRRPAGGGRAHAAPGPRACRPGRHHGRPAPARRGRGASGACGRADAGRRRNAGAGHAQRRPRPRGTARRRCRGRPRGGPPRALGDGATEPGVAGSATLVLARAALHDGDLDEARFLCRSAIDLLEHTAAPHYVAEANQVLALVEQRAGNLRAALVGALERAGGGRPGCRRNVVGTMASRIDETPACAPRSPVAAAASSRLRGCEERCRRLEDDIRRSELERRTTRWSGSCAPRSRSAAAWRPSCTTTRCRCWRPASSRSTGSSRPSRPADRSRIAIVVIAARRTLAAATDRTRRLMFELRPTSLQAGGPGRRAARPGRPGRRGGGRSPSRSRCQRSATPTWSRRSPTAPSARRS